MRRLIVAAILVSIAGCTLRQQTADDGDNPPPPCATKAELRALSGTIVYEGDPPEGARSDRGFDIWIIGAPDWETRFLAGGEDFDGHPSWSPDGQTIVFAGHAGSDSDLFLIQPDGTKLTRLTMGGRFEDYPQWIDAGIVYGRVDYHELIDSWTGNVSPFDIGNDVDYFTLSPDASRMVISRRDASDEFHLYLATPQGEVIRQLTDTNKVETHVSYSPDGRFVSYSSGDGTRSGEWEVYTLEIDTGVVFQVTSNPGADWAAGWSPDGEYLLIVSEYGDNWDVYAVRPDGTGRLRITCHEGDARAPDWTHAEPLAK